MAKARRRTTTKDIALLRQLYDDKQLTLAPEFQRNSVWPRKAKAYLIDTILNDLPIPPLLFRRGTTAQSGRPSYEVIDGQQRLRAVFSFMDNGFSLTESVGSPWDRMQFSKLSPDQQDQIRDYDFVVEELSGFSNAQIRDIFKRVNKYTVKLSNQEIRHADEAGAFAKAVERIGEWAFWKEQKVFTKAAIARMTNVEYSAELIVLLAEGPQDKKSAIDIWYQHYADAFDLEHELVGRLRSYLDWLVSAIPDLPKTRWRKHVDLYGLIGALDVVSGQGDALDLLDKDASRKSLDEFAKKVRKIEEAAKDPNAKVDAPDRRANRYFIAASRQTDNVTPRQTRIDVLAELLAP